MSFRDAMSAIIADPKAFGAPTFEEFCNNKDKIINDHEQRYIAVDMGGTAIQMLVSKYKYFFRSMHTGKRYKCKTIDEVNKVAHSEGVSDKDLDYDPQIIPIGAGKCNIHVTFFRKPSTMGLILPAGMR